MVEWENNSDSEAVGRWLQGPIQNPKRVMSSDFSYFQSDKLVIVAFEAARMFFITIMAVREKTFVVAQVNDTLR